jgi:hypothetical protein
VIRPGSPSPRVGAHGCSGKAKALLCRGWNSVCPSPPSPAQAGHVSISSPPGAGCVCRGLINPLGLFAPPGHTPGHPASALFPARCPVARGVSWPPRCPLIQYLKAMCSPWPHYPPPTHASSRSSCSTIGTGPRVGPPTGKMELDLHTTDLMANLILKQINVLHIQPSWKSPTSAL